jgi:hypothetical protein
MYPTAIISTTISFGLIYIFFSSSYSLWPGAPLSRLTLFTALLFGLFNVFLFLAPLLRPPPGSEPYKTLPYWSHAAGGLSVFVVGALYWVVWARVAPWVGGYEIVWEKGVFRRVARGGYSRVE